MERNSLWKNFFLLFVGSLLALHLNMVQASEITDIGFVSNSVLAISQ